MALEKTIIEAMPGAVLPNADVATVDEWMLANAAWYIDAGAVNIEDVGGQDTITSMKDRNKAGVTYGLVNVGGSGPEPLAHLVAVNGRPIIDADRDGTISGQRRGYRITGNDSFFSVRDAVTIFGVMRTPTARWTDYGPNAAALLAYNYGNYAQSGSLGTVINVVEGGISILANRTIEASTDVRMTIDVDTNAWLGWLIEIDYLNNKITFEDLVTGDADVKLDAIPGSGQSGAYTTNGQLNAFYRRDTSSRFFGQLRYMAGFTRKLTDTERLTCRRNAQRIVAGLNAV